MRADRSIGCRWSAIVARDFSLSAYRSLLTGLMERGYEARDYAAADPVRRHVILRHDIDMSLDAALAVAAIETELALKAHYFVLLRSEMYNPFSAGAREALQRLRALGHRIGLHLDASLYGNEPQRLQRAAQDECAALEAAVGSPVHMISFHRPASTLLGYAEPLAGRRHAYEPRFFRDMGYCSDSRGEWRGGHPLEHSAVRDGRALQLLTHPIWWTRDEQETVQARLDRFARDRYRVLRSELAANCQVYDPTLPPMPAPH
jgi:hypothetical protein